jgi:hypothetical protein
MDRTIGPAERSPGCGVPPQHGWNPPSSSRKLRDADGTRERLLGIGMNREQIDSEYRRLGYRLGWRFLMGPMRTLTTARVAVISLNPGGDRPHGPDWSSEDGSAYRIEAWRWYGRHQIPGRDPRQDQVQRLCALLHVLPDDVLAGQFVPFRSPDWESLPNKPEALAFARRLWGEVFAEHRPEIVTCIGKSPHGREVAALLGARLMDRIPAGWGDHTIERYTFDERKRLIVLPHLSRSRLFGRAASAAALNEAFR